MMELRHLDVRNFLIEECRRLANGCTTKCGCIGLMLFRNLSCLGAILCDINTIGFISKSLFRFGCKLCNRSLGVHETKRMSHVKRESAVARSYTSSATRCDTKTRQTTTNRCYCSCFGPYHRQTALGTFLPHYPAGVSRGFPTACGSVCMYV